MKIIIFILLIAVFEFSCNRFESKFYNAIDEGENQAIKTHNHTTFDLSSITDFEWDSVLVVKGNESVPVTAEEIERALHRSTTDLPTFKDRFYFLQHDKKIIVEEIESAIESDKPDYDLELCLIDSIRYRSWLSRQECKFKLMSNSFTKGHGTVFLFPPCKTFVIPDSLKIVN
jgi:hypothetical protein